VGRALIGSEKILRQSPLLDRMCIRASDSAQQLRDGTQVPEHLWSYQVVQQLATGNVRCALLNEHRQEIPSD
jgi:hypothetical protein